jgi:hypothetical protein
MASCTCGDPMSMAALVLGALNICNCFINSPQVISDEI